MQKACKTVNIIVNNENIQICRKVLKSHIFHVVWNWLKVLIWKYNLSFASYKMCVMVDAYRNSN